MRDDYGPQDMKRLTAKENLNQHIAIYQFEAYALPISITTIWVLSHKLFLENLPTWAKNFSVFPYANLQAKMIKVNHKMRSELIVT